MQPTSTVTVSDVQNALARVRTALPVTPLTHSALFSELLRREVYFKWDNKLRTGSFKERGVVNLLLSLSEEERRRGVCAGSAGNHALALSYHAARMGIPCTIVMPTTAPLVKIEATRATGATVELHGHTFADAYQQARSLAADRQLLFVSAFDDERVIAGQGTAALEILEQLPDTDMLLVPVGGGGLISGMALAAKALRPQISVYGAQSEWIVRERTAPSSADRLLQSLSIADGIAVKSIGAITGPLIERFVDHLCTVSEEQVAHAIMRVLEFERTVLEGAGAAATAALLSCELPPTARKIVVMVSGSNIDLNVLSRLIQRDMAQQQRLLKLSVSVPDRPGSLNALTSLIARQGANVLEVTHDRSFSQIPGDVKITFVLEVRNRSHREQIVSAIQEVNLAVEASPP